MIQLEIAIIYGLSWVQEILLRKTEIPLATKIQIFSMFLFLFLFNFKLNKHVFHLSNTFSETYMILLKS